MVFGQAGVSIHLTNSKKEHTNGIKPENTKLRLVTFEKIFHLVDGCLMAYCVCPLYDSIHKFFYLLALAQESRRPIVLLKTIFSGVVSGSTV